MFTVLRNGSSLATTAWKLRMAKKTARKYRDRNVLPSQIPQTPRNRAGGVLLLRKQRTRAVRVVTQRQLPESTRQFTAVWEARFGEDDFVIGTRTCCSCYCRKRYERGSVLLSINLPFSKWEQIFEGPTTTTAAIDRFIHHSVIIELNTFLATPENNKLFRDDS